MKMYRLSNVSDGVIILRNKNTKLELKAKTSTVISESVIMLFKDQISTLSKVNKVLTLTENTAKVEEVKVETKIVKPRIKKEESKEVKVEESKEQVEEKKAE
jgi:ABC-type oligopeptide transport system ATPase subunit